jgi:hypothetical protein
MTNRNAKFGGQGTHLPRAVVILGLFGPLAAASMIAGDLFGSFLTPDYSPRSQAISELVAIGAAQKPLVDLFLLAFHMAVIPFAISLFLALGSNRWAKIASILLASAGIAGVLLTLFFPCDPGCVPFVSLRGTLHIFIAIPMGIAILVAIFLFARVFDVRAGWQRFAMYSKVTAITGLVLAVITVVTAESAWVGLLERTLTLSYLQWYAVIGVVIVRGGLPRFGSN